MLNDLLSDFLIRAGVAGVAVAAVAGPLGCFVLWRRLAYFGDAAGHAALLGVALGLALDAPALLGPLAATLAVGLLLARADDGRDLAPDALLGAAAQASLAFGLIAFSLMPGVRVDLTGYLFGDVLSVSPLDVVWTMVGAAAVLATLAARWRGLVTVTLSEQLAAAEGRAPARERLVLMLCLAATVALAMQVVGLLMIGALLILPAVAARPLARTPEGMALAAAGIGALSVIGGLNASLRFDAPAGPAIVAAAFAAVLLSRAAATLRRGR